MSETALVKAALQWLDWKRIPAWRNNTGAVQKRHTDASGATSTRFIRFGIKGASDILGVLPPNGRILAAEAKVGRNKATAAQQEFLDMINAAGGLAFVFYSIDELEQKIQEG